MQLINTMKKYFYFDIGSTPSIEDNTIYETVIKKVKKYQTFKYRLFKEIFRLYPPIFYNLFFFVYKNHNQNKTKTSHKTLSAHIKISIVL